MASNLEEMNMTSETEPQYVIRHRSYPRSSRASAPSPVPRELVVTIELPLTHDADDIKFYSKGKAVELEAKPVYKLSIRLPYLVKDQLTTGTFNKYTKQMVITMPVVWKNPPKLLPVPGYKEVLCLRHNGTTEIVSLPHSHPKCTILSCSQDATSVTLIIHVKTIHTHSITSEVSTNRCEIRFHVVTGPPYVFIVAFLPEYLLNNFYISTSVSADNMVIKLTKSPECFGPWKNLFFGVNSNSLQERFIEENVAGPLRSPPHSPIPWAAVEDPPLINVMGEKGPVPAESHRSSPSSSSLLATAAAVKRLPDS